MTKLGTYHDDDQNGSRLTGRNSELNIVLLEFLNSARVNHVDDRSECRRKCV